MPSGTGKTITLLSLIVAYQMVIIFFQEKVVHINNVNLKFNFWKF